MGVDGMRNDMLAKVRERVVQQFANDAAVKNINAHRGQIRFLVAFEAHVAGGFRSDPQRIQQRVLLGLLHKARDAAVVGHLQNAAGLGLAPAHRKGGDGDVRAGFTMLLDHLLKIHPVQLVAA